MGDLFFYGKLKNKRDFVCSPFLSNEERMFWSNWFDGCVVSKSLPNFLKQRLTPKTWIFFSKTQALWRIGAIAMSQDYSGRLYPFVVYQTIDAQSLLENPDIQVLLKTIKIEGLLLMLEKSIEAGEVIDYQNISKQALEHHLISQKLQNCLNMFCKADTQSQSYSCWVKLADSTILEIFTSPTRSLYTRLFG